LQLLLTCHDDVCCAAAAPLLLGAGCAAIDQYLLPDRQGCNGKFLFWGTVSKTTSSGGGCAPAHGGRVACWGWVRGIFEIFFTPNPAFGGNLGQKINLLRKVSFG